MAQLDEGVLRALYAAACAMASLRILMIALTCIGSGWSALALVLLLAPQRTRAFAAGLGAALAVAAAAAFGAKHAVGAFDLAWRSPAYTPSGARRPTLPFRAATRRGRSPRRRF